MKTMKKIASVAAATCLAFTMVTATAVYAIEENTSSITISNTTAGHTYEAYQVFTGTYAGGKLTGITWGHGVNSTALLTALQADATLATDMATATTADDVATVIAGYANDSAKAQAFASVVGANLSTTVAKTVNTQTNDAYVMTGMLDGYYFIKDQDATMGGRNDAYTSFILKVAGEDVAVAPKTGTPSVYKKVYEESTNSNFELSGDTYDKYNDVADYDIGDAVPFMLYGTMPSNLADYSAYYYCFTDTLDDSFDDPTNIVVKIDGTTITEGTNLRVTYVGNDITVSFEDIKAAGVTLTAASIVTVEYTATLNANAVIGLNGQENKVDLTYSNNPNVSYKPNTTDDNNDKPGDDNEGKTPEDKVIVFTYELDVTKYLGTTDTAAGANDAGFKLQKNGKYATLTNNKITGWVDSIDDATEIFTDANGKLSFIGIDDGEYTIYETTVPDGFNGIEPKDFTVTATTANGQTWSGTAADALTAINLDGTVGNITNGTVDMSIINKSGSELPSTGGMGTTIFYVAGGIVVVGAGVLLITKKRMNGEEK